MISPRNVFTAILLSPALITSFAYQWPSPQYDALEQFVVEGTDHIGLDIGGVTRHCTHRNPPTASTVAAEWVRLVSLVLKFMTFQCLRFHMQAYHDMATHNVDDGTGGLDASIFFELDRAEVFLIWSSMAGLALTYHCRM